MSQMQMIQSLGEAMAWFKREINWGVAPGELRHLSGRIGELYVAMLTNGRMALATNQKGYDVVGANNEHISVKTTTMQGSAGHVSFNQNTLEDVHRVVVLRIDADEDEIKVLLDAPIEEARKLMTPSSSATLVISLSKISGKPKVRGVVKSVISATFENYVVREMENGSIEVSKNGQDCDVAKPELRVIAQRLGMSIENSNGNAFNTRELGSSIIKRLLSVTANSVG